MRLSRQFLAIGIGMVRKEVIQVFFSTRKPYAIIYCILIHFSFFCFSMQNYNNIRNNANEFNKF